MTRVICSSVVQGRGIRSFHTVVAEFARWRELNCTCRERDGSTAKVTSYMGFAGAAAALIEYRCGESPWRSSSRS